MILIGSHDGEMSSFKGETQKKKRKRRGRRKRERKGEKGIAMEVKEGTNIPVEGILQSVKIMMGLEGEMDVDT